MDIKIFVYGTLKKGRGNDYLLDSSKFLGNYYTKQKYIMYNVGFPIVSTPNNKQRIYAGYVAGELYLVNKEVLQNLDQLEGCPHWYIRININLNKNQTAQMYYQKPKEIDEYNTYLIRPKNGLLIF